MALSLIQVSPSHYRLTLTYETVIILTSLSFCEVQNGVALFGSSGDLRRCQVLAFPVMVVRAGAEGSPEAARLLAHSLVLRSFVVQGMRSVRDNSVGNRHHS